MKFKIRKLTLKDLPQLKKLFREEPFKEILDKYLKK